MMMLLIMIIVIIIIDIYLADVTWENRVYRIGYFDLPGAVKTNFYTLLT
jgi:hypothetical protein